MWTSGLAPFPAEAEQLTPAVLHITPGADSAEGAEVSAGRGPALHGLQRQHLLAAALLPHQAVAAGAEVLQEVEAVVAGRNGLLIRQRILSIRG